MSTEKAKNLKKTFSNASEDEFEPLTFGELKVGELFIDFPLPGDNSGHGGFRGTNYLFKKTDDENANNVKRNIESHFHDSMIVIRVQ